MLASQEEEQNHVILRRVERIEHRHPEWDKTGLETDTAGSLSCEDLDSYIHEYLI